MYATNEQKQLKLRDEKNLRHCTIAENALEDRDRSTNDDVVADVLHDGSRLSGHQCQQHRRLVQVPEQEQLATTGCGASDVAEEVGVRVPEDAVKTQHHLTTTVPQTTVFNQISPKMSV